MSDAIKTLVAATALAVRLALWRALCLVLCRLSVLTGWIWLDDLAMSLAGIVESIERPLRDRAHARELSAAINCGRSSERRGGQR